MDAVTGEDGTTRVPKQVMNANAQPGYAPRKLRRTMRFDVLICSNPTSATWRGHWLRAWHRLG
jgi:hypothetical protein